MFYKLHYFKKSETGICADDFNNKTKIVTINLSMILSISDLQKFSKPLSGDYVGQFALLTMSNNDKYYIDKSSFSDLTNVLNELTKATV